MKNDHRSIFSNLSKWKKKPEKIKASTGFEPVASAIPYILHAISLLTGYCLPFCFELY